MSQSLAPEKRKKAPTLVESVKSPESKMNAKPTIPASAKEEEINRAAQEREGENDKKRKGRPKKAPLFDGSPKNKNRKTKESNAVTHHNIIKYDFQKFLVKKDKMIRFSTPSTTFNTAKNSSTANGMSCDEEATIVDVMHELKKMQEESTNLGNSIKERIEKDTASLRGKIQELKEPIQKLETEKNNDKQMIMNKLKSSRGN